MSVQVFRFTVCALVPFFLTWGCSKAKGPEGTWEVSAPTIATTADQVVEVPTPKATLTINQDGSFTLLVEGSWTEASQGTWQREGNNLRFRVKGEGGQSTTSTARYRRAVKRSLLSLSNSNAGKATHLRSQND